MASFKKNRKTLIEILSETNRIRNFWIWTKLNLQAMLVNLLRQDSKSFRRAYKSINPKNSFNKSLNYASFILYFLRLGVVLSLRHTDIKEGKKKIAHLKDSDREAYDKALKKIYEKANDDYLALIVNDIISGVGNFFTSSIFAQILKVATGATFGGALAYVSAGLLAVDVGIAVGFYFGRARKKYFKEKAAIEKKYIEDLENNLKEECVNAIRKSINNKEELANSKQYKDELEMLCNNANNLKDNVDANFKQKAENEKNFKLKKLAIEHEFKRNSMAIDVATTIALFTAYALILPFAPVSLITVAAPLAMIAYTAKTIQAHFNELNSLKKTIALYQEYKDKNLVDSDYKEQFDKDYKKYVENANHLKNKIKSKLAITAITGTLFVTVGILAPIFLPTIPAILAIAATGLLIALAVTVANKKVDKHFDSKMTKGSSKKNNESNQIEKGLSKNRTNTLDEKPKPKSLEKATGKTNETKSNRPSQASIPGLFKKRNNTNNTKNNLPPQVNSPELGKSSPKLFSPNIPKGKPENNFNTLLAGMKSDGNNQ